MAFKASNELEHAFTHAHTVTDNSNQKFEQLQRNEKVPWWVRKQLAAFSTTKETVVDCKLAVAYLVIAETVAFQSTPPKPWPVKRLAGCPPILY